MSTVITACTVLVLGVLLGAGGTWLAVLGGSWAYGVVGLALGACGVLLLRRRRIALTLYAAVLVAAAAWSLWEVGLDRWALVPMGALLAVIGLWLLAPWIDRSLAEMDEAGAAPAPARSSWPGPRGWAAAAMVVVVAIAATSITRDPFDVAGRLPDAPVAPFAPVAAQGRADAPGAAGDDWPAYGGTGLGQRYLSLRDITPETVSRPDVAWTSSPMSRSEAPCSRVTTCVFALAPTGTMLIHPAVDFGPVGEDMSEIRAASIEARSDRLHHLSARSNAPDDDLARRVGLLQHLDQRPRVLAKCDGVGIFGLVIIQSRAALDIGQYGLFFGDGKVQGLQSREHVAWLQDALRRNWLTHDAQQSIANRAGHQQIAGRLALELVDHVDASVL